MTEQITVTDFRGNTFTVGDTVLYPRMSGRSCELQEGVVVELKPFEDFRYFDNPKWGEEGEPRWVREDFTNHKVRIQPTRSSRFHRTGTDWRGEAVKPVWIQLGENVVRA